jgi:hypothetical protein
MTPSRGFSFTTTMWMIHRIHRDTANRRSFSQPAPRPAFPRLMLNDPVTHLANGRHAFNVNLTNSPEEVLPEHIHLSIQLGSASSRANQLCAFLAHFEIVDRRA